MGNCFQTSQVKGYPVLEKPTTPKHLVERQLSQNLPLQNPNTQQIQNSNSNNSGGSSKNSNTNSNHMNPNSSVVAIHSKPTSPIAGFMSGIIQGIRSPKISATAFFNHPIDLKKEATSVKIHGALQKRINELKDRQITFPRIILKFEKLSNVLKDVKSVFYEVSEGYPDGLNLQGLQDAMKNLEVNMTKEEVADLFGFIDLDGSMKIELKEFLVALTIGMVLDKIPAFQNIPIIQSPEPSPKGMGMLYPTNALVSPRSTTFVSKTSQIKDMLSLIVTAYLLFDPTGEGLIRRDAVEKVLEEVGHQAGKNAMLSGDKWKEMDWDMNGTIDFAEFVMAFSTWVDVNDVMESE